MMEAGRNLLTSASPPRTTFKNCPSPLPRGLFIRELAARPLTSMPTASLAWHFPASVLLQEQRDEGKPLLHTMKEDRMFQAALDGRQMTMGLSALEENGIVDSDQFLKDFERQLLHWPGLWSLFLSSRTGGPSLSPTMQLDMNNTNIIIDVKPFDALNLAKKALSASKQAASLVEDSKLLDPYPQESVDPSSVSTNMFSFPTDKAKTVRSTRLLQRRSKKRKVSKPKVIVQETNTAGRTSSPRKISESNNLNDPVKLFLRGPETKQLLTVQEESQLIVQIQDLLKLEEVKSRLQTQFDREPTLNELSEAVGLSCQGLQSQIHCGNSCREKLIYANFRLVVHVAKQYQGCGLSLPDLLQEGSMGLMRSVEKFKPQTGCRFASYAYWWIKHAIRRAIFQHSRTIRLPDNIYSLLYKVTQAKRSCIQEGHHHPTKTEIAARVGITVEKLEKLLFTARVPLSMQQTVWMDQDTTFQEITADTAIEIPDVSVSKQLMRRHIRNLLSILTPKERKIIKLRFGLEDGTHKSLSEIGCVFGLSKERVRQLESRSLYKLKQCLSSQGLNAYSDLLV